MKEKHVHENNIIYCRVLSILVDLLSGLLKSCEGWGGGRGMCGPFPVPNTLAMPLILRFITGIQCMPL